MRTRRLIVQAPEGERELLFVGRLTVGRAPECDISVADTKISRRHAEFDATGPMPRVSDLGSRNGLLVNGRKVAGADLSTGDVVTIGDLRIRFEEVVPTAAPPRAPITADRTAVLPSPSAPPPPAPRMAPQGGAPAARQAPEPVEAALAAPPHGAAGRALPADPLPAAQADDRTAVLPRPAMPVARGARPAEPPPSDDRTAVIPRPQVPARAPVADAPAAVASSHGTGAANVAAVAAPAVPVAPADARFGSASAPTPARPAPSPVRAAPAVPIAVADPGDTTPAGASIADAPAASSAAPAASAVPPAGAQAAPVARGPRFSWGGLVILVCVALGGLGVLLGALPLMSASATTVDQLSRRQVRTLGGWVGSAVRPDGSVDERVLADVLSQPGVESAVVLDVASGQAMAPGRLLGRAFDSLPVVGPQWRSMTSPTVTMSTGYADAFVPVTAGSRRYVAWVRYVPPSASENGLAVIVGLLSTLVLALLMAMLVRRHTAATLQHFTRQVELVVSGANPKVIDGRLLPGIDRLPGVVTYLLEQRRSSAIAPGAVMATGPTAAGAPGVAHLQVDEPVAPPPPVGPAWIEVTPSLSVVATSAHAPDRGMRDWTSAPGRHLLDVLEPGPLCNAVVQGLGALGMAAGAEVSIPVPDQRPVTLRREPSTHVRVELAMR